MRVNVGRERRRIRRIKQRLDDQLAAKGLIRVWHRFPGGKRSFVISMENVVMREERLP